jgi:hypothetical protein
MRPELFEVSQQVGEVPAGDEVGLESVLDSFECGRPANGSDDDTGQTAFEIQAQFSQGRSEDTDRRGVAKSHHFQRGRQGGPSRGRARFDVSLEADDVGDSGPAFFKLIREGGGGAIAADQQDPRTVELVQSVGYKFRHMLSRRSVWPSMTT